MLIIVLLSIIPVVIGLGVYYGYIAKGPAEERDKRVKKVTDGFQITMVALLVITVLISLFYGVSSGNGALMFTSLL